jgi:hypothetical protein
MPGTYWPELKGALDVNASNEAKLKHARAAIKAESEMIDRAFDLFNSNLHNVDRAVAQLVEIANSVRDSEYRKDAIEVSQRARELHSGYQSLGGLLNEGFVHRRKILDGIVAEGGALAPVFRRFPQEGDKITVVTAQQEDARKQLSAAESRLKDAFSALAGAAKLKKYPSKSD